MPLKRITKKLTHIAAYTLGGLIVLLIVFHFWFVRHAKSLIEDLVSSQSKGKLALQIDKFNFNWFSRNMVLQQATFYSTDTATATTAYRFKVDRIKIQVKKILPLVFEKRFLIDSIHLINPDISVTKLRVRDSTIQSDTSVSIPQEMGRIYNSIQDALRVLRVDRFQIDNGKFSLFNKTRPEEKPIVISRLNFYLDNLQVDTTKSGVQKKILFSDNVALQTDHQNILFPDGRHHLSFANFRINIRNRIAEFDSCTIGATKEDSSNNSFRIFFDKLRMTNIDFDTLYHTEVIKADSVYCINPRFRLDVDLPKRKGPVQPPRLDEIIQQLTGNMELAFVVVQNASFDINTIREGRPSSFTSDNNNFELQGLRIQEKATKPLTVDRFAMAIRNFENFLRDSAYSIEFDSIIINNNRISLSNFAYKELEGNKAVNSLVMPQFEMQGLSWDSLIFNQQFNAERVTLIQPVINYRLGKSQNDPSKDIVAVLSNLSKTLQLSHLDIINGQVNLFFGNNSKLQLEGATMSIAAKKLVDSRMLRDIHRSVGQLHFTRGLFQTGSLTARLENVQFRGANNGLNAGTVIIEDKNALNAVVKDVSFQSMVVNDKLSQVVINGINWKQADVQLLSFPGPGKASSSLTLHNITGYNTKLAGLDADKKISVYLESISANEVSLLPGQPLKLTGLRTKGNDLKITDKANTITISDLSVNDRQSSSLSNIVYRSYSGNDSISINIPSITLVPDINSIIKGDIHADEVVVSKPTFRINLKAEPSAAKTKLQTISINSLTIKQPNIYFVSINDRGTATLEWKGGDETNYFNLGDLKVNNETSSISAGQLGLSMGKFLYTDVKGKTFDAGNGKLLATINNLALHKNETDNWDWQGTIANLSARNFVIDSIGTKGGQLVIDLAKLSDFSLNSTWLLSMRELISQNTRFNLTEVTGSYMDRDDQYQWYNAQYDKRIKFFSLDSFSYRPTPSRDEFIKALKFQDDYMTARTGRINIGPFDIQRYIKDTVLDFGIMTIENGYLSNHRDKRIPRQPGSVRPLPANLLKKIGTHVIVDEVNIKNAHVDYEEVNDKTNALGAISVHNLNGTVKDARNFNLRDGDTLDIKATGYLQGTIHTKLHVREAYTDPLGGFTMTAQMGPADMTILNPILSPLASIQLRSGWLDTMTLRVIGREELAFGEVKMFYHGLKIRVERKNKTYKTFSGFSTFLANMLIKNENKNRVSPIFFQRLRDRSAINYLVKIALNGMSSSVGIGKSKRMIRKHKDEVKSKPLPPFER